MPIPQGRGAGEFIILHLCKGGSVALDDQLDRLGLVCGWHDLCVCKVEVSVFVFCEFLGEKKRRREEARVWERRRV